MSEGAGSTESPPVCYRHPGREAHIRCNRCERYICPDDMISAAVGFQCPECVKGANAGVRQPRTVSGATVRQSTGLVTMAIIVVNVLIFLAVQGSDTLANQLSLTPISADDDGLMQGGWHRLITGAFVHEEPLHIAMNMIGLWLFGRPLEAILGWGRFLATYMICAIGGSTLSYMFMSYLGPGSIGASGAFFGLVGALVMVDRQLRANPSAVAIYLVIMLVPGFVVSNIDWRGHIGGLITGAVLGILFAYAPRANRLIWHVAGCVAVTALLLVAVQLRTEHLKDQIRHELSDGRISLSAPAFAVPNGDNPCGELQACDLPRFE
jgi:membrane associated rhomboid family serine protease